ncbi:MAG: SH3 domain-containing protein [Lentisphaerae bacterium]|nr:SH3 domain-containing protein [Lentisphaerota bacterium]
MKLRRWMLSFLCCSAAAAAAAADVEVTVTADRVNLRAEPSLRAEVVGQASEGDRLTATPPLDAEWVRIVPPPQVSLWLYGELVEGDRVRVSAAQVRAGPGINYKVVGRLDKGQTVEPTGRRGDWLSIEPPPGAYLWISGRYVRRVEDKPRPAPVQQAAGPPAPPVPAPPSAAMKPPLPADTVRAPAPPAARHPAREAGSAPAPPALTGRTLVPGKPQGTRVIETGVLRRAMFVWRRPSRYSLAKRDEKGRYYTACFVLGDPDTLGALAGKPVRAAGRLYWLQGVRDPALVAESVAGE